MLQLTRRSLGGALALAACVLSGCADAPEFVSTVDKFKVKFGTAPQTSDRVVGGTRSVTYKVETSDGARSVTVTELPVKGDEPPEFVPWVLNSAKGDLIRAAGGKEESSGSHVLAGKYAGREFSASITQPTRGAMRARIWVVGPRLYQVMVIGTDAYVQSDLANEFLNSFQLTE
ncbi:hypothetical protein R5W24_001319 [Gemmata sp. JC717]|uniref:hypothetical protein n=1 Tax=Gemmata algarum TaxID=2975278 RepID=UPI0021BB5EDF|nr:hypothetical protein [Gemmata algarum]MDY3552239.1 hypothetical protein [Gemmata algarum]